MMTIRQATAADVPEIISLCQNSIRYVCVDDYSPEQISAWVAAVANTECWQQAVASQYFLVAEQDGQLLGFGSLEQGNYIDFLYVHHQHQREGIAQALYDRLLAEARRTWQAQVDTCASEEAPVNTGAINAAITSEVSKTARPFFQKQGFVVLGENVKQLGGVQISNYTMELRLEV